MVTRMLSIDDDPLWLDYLRTALRGVVDLTTLERGDTAVEVIQDVRPHLVTVDLVMGRPDGLTLIERVAPHVTGPLVVLSAHAPSPFSRSALALGATHAVAKSDFDPADVPRWMEEVSASGA